MTGIEFESLLRFIIQVSAALMGAAALWGFVFLHASSKAGGEKPGLKKAGFLLMPLFIAAFVAFMASWWYGALVVFAPDAFAHEGIADTSVPEHIINAFRFNLPWVSLLGLAGISGILMRMFSPQKFKKYAKVFYILQFVLVSVVISFLTYSGDLREQIANIIHNWHSILTLGTVITVDFLFLFSIKNDVVKRDLYKFFPLLSAFIWIGLGLDFISSYFSWGGRESLEVTSQFLFNQTVVGIIIINGALLSGKINKALINLIRPEGVGEFAGRFKRIVGFSGAVSITSWLTISFLGFFEIPLGYLQFMGVYIAVILAVFLSKPFIEALIAKNLSQPPPAQ